MSRACRMLLLSALLSFSGAVFAQTQYEPEIRQTSLDSFPGKEAITEAAAFRERMSVAKKKFEKEEAELITLKNRMESSGHSTIDFLNLMTNINGDAVQINTVRSAMVEIKPVATELDRRIDAYIQDEMDMSIAIGFHAVREDLAKLSYRNVDMRLLYRSLVKQKNQYLELKKEYGEKKDHLRVTAHTNFMSTLKNLYDAMENPLFSRSRRIGRSIERLASKVKWVADRPELLGAFLKTLKFVMSTPQPVGTTNPLLAAVNKLSRQLGDELGLEVTIEGKENLQVPQGPNEITILVPSHRDAIKDQIGIANLHFEDGTEFDSDQLAPFAAAHVYPGFLSKKLKPNDGIVMTEPGVSAISRMLEIVDNTELRLFLNYAGGRLPDGFGGTMGVRKKFFKMVKDLEEKGYKVNILAVAMRDNAKLFGTRELTNNPNITVEVAPLLRHDTRHLIMDVAGEDAIALMMRIGLIQKLVTNDDLIFGQVRASKLMEALNEIIFGDPNCDKLLSSAKGA